MLLRRYGTALHSVVTDFDPRAMTEVRFRRDRERSIPADEFEAGWEKVREEGLTAESEGAVQSEAEQEVLDRLEARLTEVIEGLGEGEVAVVESEHGNDYPKLRERKEGVIIKGENRLHFHWWVDPPLRVGVYRSSGR
jgi:hypothetical protein